AGHAHEEVAAPRTRAAEVGACLPRLGKPHIPPVSPPQRLARTLVRVISRRETRPRAARRDAASTMADRARTRRGRPRARSRAAGADWPQPARAAAPRAERRDRPRRRG